MSTKLLVFNHTASIVYVKKYPKSGLKQFNYVFFFFLNDGRSKLASFFYHFLIVYQAIYLFAAIETDAKNFTGKIGVIELVLRTVMYLIRYFRGIMWVDF